MKPVIFGLLGAASLLAGGLFAYVRSGRTAELSSPVLREPETHRVTPAMLGNSEARSNLQAPLSAELRATDGTTRSLAELAARGPFVLVFIKDGCPCSADAQRFFNRLEQAYGVAVPFLGVIDANTDRGRAWGGKNATTFPLCADPDLAVVHDYRAEGSAYMAVVARGGVIDHVYPGYSREMLQDASRRLARLGGVPERPIDATGAPDVLTTGCPY